MDWGLERRQLLQAATLGLALPAWPGSARILGGRGFTHNVASGEPSPRSVLLWTRYVSGADQILATEVAEDPSFARVVAGVQATASADRDFTAKAVVQGLEPDRWYFYRFVAPDGSTSPVGRTRTLPEGPTSRFRLGVFSCANLPYGYFNAYAHAAARSDLDLMVHLGDYFYEYESTKYANSKLRPGERDIDPATEIVRLDDYRRRYACYRRDPDLQALHQAFPMVAQWDDHEIANDCWRDGAENHQPDVEGDWATRKAAAVRAFHEWMPVSGDAYNLYQIGELATLFRLETRLTGRSEQFRFDRIVRAGADPRAALRAFRDGPWMDPGRSLLGGEQERWLAAAIRQSVRSGTRWQLLAQQVNMGRLAMPPAAAGFLRPDASDTARQRIGLVTGAAALGLPANLDNWNGYPVARSRILRAAAAAGANLVVLSGDSHNGWGFDLMEEGRAMGVEFGGQGVTSPGLESQFSRSPTGLAEALIAANPELRWCDTSRRGYMTVELRPDAATAEWQFVSTILERNPAIAATHRASVRHGRRRLDPV